MNELELKLHESYIQRCFELARRSGKHVKSNPQVGSVIVYQDRIIGEGAHQRYGQAHAEVNAFKSVLNEDSHLLAKATIYVSLEPCNHTGKTGPCAQAIVDHGVKRVIISAIDPDPRVAGQSISFLKSRGVEVIEGICKSEGEALIRPFVINQQESRPYVMLKFAQSYDHFMGRPNESVWISNSFSKILTHQWRSEVDAILIGVNTLLVDNPLLTTRLVKGEHPLPVIIDPSLRSDWKSAIFQTDLKPIVFSSVAREHDQVNIIQIDFEADPVVQILEYLYHEQDVCRLLVEGGRKTIDEFLSEGLWDLACIFTAKHQLRSGIKAPSVSGVRIHDQLIENDQLHCIFRT